jgi:hypothetical protein
VAESVVPESKPPTLWWGPILSSQQAGEIVAWTAWSLLLLGLAPIAAVTMSLILGELSLSWPVWDNFGQNWLVLGQFSFALIQIGAAAILLRTRSWMSAVILMGCCVFVVVIVLATLMRLLTDGGDTVLIGLQDIILLTALGFFIWVIWRAMEATQAIRRLRQSEHFI